MLSSYDASSSSEIVNWWLLPAFTINRRLRSLTSSHVTERSKNPCRRPSLTSSINLSSRLLKNSAKWDRQIDPVVLRCSQH